MEKIEELKRQLEELKNQIDGLKSQLDINDDIIKKGDVYYFVTPTLEVAYHVCENTDYDIKMMKYNKIFKNQEDAERYAKYLEAKYTYTCNFTKKEFADVEVPKWFILFSVKDCKYEIVRFYANANLGGFTFKSEKDAESFIDICGIKDILEFEFDIKEEK